MGLTGVWQAIDKLQCTPTPSWIGFCYMKLLAAIPALPVSNIEQSAAFYQDKLGFEIGYQEAGFAILRRDAIEIHLWQAADQNWRTSVVANTSPVRSGAESFLAGTASCRIGVEGVDELCATIEPHGLMHPNAPLKNTDYGTCEFAVLDGDGNLITFFERLG
ncbi:bleomycin resistance protein [Abditibacteriota bacterium]|nr:bleomycin resistance protein [Abditibacteriota bacterium]